MSKLPEKRYLRRGEIRSYFGITDRDFTALITAGVLVPVYFRGKGRAFFRRDLVLAAEANEKIFGKAES